MANTRVRMAAGLLLVAAGILVLLQNFGIVRSGLSLLWSLCFLAAGAIFTFVFINDRKNWWAVIPGFTLLGIGALILLDWALPATGGRWGGPLFLGALGASFWVIYANRREQWWPIIPGGVLLTLALVAALDDGVGVGFDTGSLFFLGLAATFFLVYLLSQPGSKMSWALYPAGVLAVLGVVIAFASSSLARFLGPLALLVAGGYLVYRAMARPKAGL
jgi:hypothetical protein